MLKQLTTIGLLGLALAGCVTAEERAQQILAKEREACTAYGFRPGTEQFAQCMMQTDHARMQAVAALGGALLSRPIPSNAPQRLSTSCVQIGNTINCN
jgi:hypothetical protein